MSTKLWKQIRSQIRQDGDMCFSEFMHRALYTPNLGYYSSGTQKFGAEGDFITAPELTPLFGQTLARQCQSILHTLHQPVLFEFGAGSGRLCVDILTELERMDALPNQYQILEVSADLQRQQRTLIQAKLPHVLDRIIWLSEWPTSPFEGIIIANEVLDAMPVHRFLVSEEGLLESYVTLNSQDVLTEVYKPAGDSRLASYIDVALPKTIGAPYQSEANLFIDDWMRHCFAMLTAGVFFIFDYGFPRKEYYHPDRNTGTLMCHYQHKAHTNPLIHVGEQDITAHVDFTHVAEAADAAGFHVAGYTNQASFLVANGLLSLLSEIHDERALFRAQQAVKQLLQPEEMGELFKVVALTKTIEPDLVAFQWQDKRASL